MATIKIRKLVAFVSSTTVALSAIWSLGAQAQQSDFRLEEATIAGVHEAIQAGELTCLGFVQSYIDRARVYNGVTNQLVTRDGEPVEAVPGTIRAGAPIQFPTQTVAISEFLPDFEDYRGPPIEFGRMEPTASDPSVYQQFGMTVGMPDAGQTNALGTLNLRGERSVTCKGDADRHPSAGAIPDGSHPACQVFRQYPDALEQAMGRDQWGGCSSGQSPHHGTQPQEERISQPLPGRDRPIG